MIGLLFNFFLVALLAPAFYAFVYEGVLFLASVFTFEATQWFFGGIVLFLFFYVPFLHGNIGFIEHLLHELEHAALPFLFTLKLPRRMEVDPQEGSVVFVAYGGCALVALAPYYLPLLTLFFLGLKGLASLALSLLEAPFPQFLAVILDLLIGATLMFHLVCTVQEFRLSQPDIKGTGRIASIIAVLFLSFMFVLLSVAVVTGSYAELVDYGKAALATTQDAYQAVLDFAQTRVLPMVSDWSQTLKDQFCLQCTPTPAPTP
jgi:hypothetical protein